MVIRQETVQDYDEVYRLVQKAFADAEHRDGNEQDLVVALRKGDAFVPGLSLVAVIDGKIVGYILFTKAKVGGSTVLVLAPLAVLPAFQRQGVGSALIREGHRLAAAQGYAYSIVLGSDAYYPRFGYRPAEAFGIEVPAGICPANFMAIRLREDAGPLAGSVAYPKEFGL